ncbi:MAG: glycosyltransferase family 2 protein, partial [Candidatus Aenigmatarchaeota archaeon]
MIPGLDFIGLPMMYAITFFALFNGLYIMCILLENRNGFKSPKEGRVYTLSAIVPVYNGAKHLKECVESLQGLNYPKGKVEIIVVDDGSKDNSYETAKKMKGVRAYRIRHAGKSAAVNFGIERAKGELIGILDVDSSVSPDALRRMTGFFSDKKVGAVHSGMRVKNKGNFIEKFQELEYMFALLFKKIFSTIDGLYVTPGVFSVYRKSL